MTPDYYFEAKPTVDADTLFKYICKQYLNMSEKAKKYSNYNEVLEQRWLANAHGVRLLIDYMFADKIMELHLGKEDEVFGSK